MTSRKERYMQVQDNLPAFIIGLPQDLLEADLAKSKFAETIVFLKKIAPEIEEARCKIKTILTEGKKSRYEVSVSIITPYGRHTYANSDWDLAKIFGTMSESLKKKFIEEKEKGNTREKSRHA